MTMTATIKKEAEETDTRIISISKCRSNGKLQVPFFLLFQKTLHIIIQAKKLAVVPLQNEFEKEYSTP